MMKNGLKFAAKLAVLMLFFTIVKGDTNAPYDYEYNGADWGENFHDCGNGGYQSPIDLRNYLHSNPFPNVTMNDELKKSYSNIYKKQIKWVGNTIKVEVENPKTFNKIQYFDSSYAPQYYGADNRYNAAQFHFHSESEHTINGKRFDFEMHIVHFANQTKNGIIAAALGMIFDTIDYDKSISPELVLIIDRFFDSMMLDDQSDPIAQEIPFGQLMNMVDTNNRWAYKGSLTTPPCSKTIYFNILTKVYPIKERHVEMFKKHLARVEGLREKGNYRAVQPIDKQDVKLITNYVKEVKGDQQTLIIALIVLVVIMIIAIAIVGYIIVLNNQEKQRADLYTEKPQPKHKSRDDHEGGNQELEISDVPNRTSRIPVSENEIEIQSARENQTNDPESNKQ